ncbi:hypothetical protein [Bacteroides neonati]|uniref:hypothetical protein n=1 Tax=Bacteroides neonati TaxID=1347393 RepID=UPI0004AD7E58|nr:hypothetical protein [Bacteroides neonati]
MRNNILASIALFQDLYDNGNQDIFSVIAEFVKATIHNNNLHAFNITSLRILIKTDFEIDVPEGVLKTVLKKRLSQEVSKDRDNTYNAMPLSIIVEQFKENQKAQTTKYEFVFDKLLEFYRLNKGLRMTVEQEEEFKSNFADFLLSTQKEQGDCLFSRFIIENESDENFIDCLNEIRDGYIILHGIKDITDSTDLNTIGSWDSKLTIYLDTEHLFSFYGYNGELFKEVFDDFISLVKEANKRTKYIELKYFEETKNTMDGYFYVATQIKDGKIRPYAQTAMNTILRKCLEKSDVIAEKGRFFSFLKSNDIVYDDRAGYVSEMSGNLQTNENITAILKDSLDKDLTFEEETISKYLRMFSIINNRRNTNSKTSFEKSKCILMTANSVASFVAWHPLIKNENEFSLSSDIDFITAKLWFKLHKGLINGKKPISFNVMTKTKLVINSMLYKSASIKYDELSKRNYSKDEEISVFNAIREHEILPENITSENIGDIIDFINIKSVDDLRRETSFLKEKVRQGEEYAAELKKIKFNSRKSEKNKIKHKYTTLKYLMYTLISIVALGLSWIVYYVVSTITTPSDSPLAIISALFTVIVVPLLTAIPRFRKMALKYIKKKKYCFFRTKLKTLV